MLINARCLLLFHPGFGSAFPLTAGAVTEQGTAAAFAGSRVLVTGASGALGGELARQLAAPGVTLLLWGRDLPRLDAAASACRAAGALAVVQPVDLADLPAALAALAAQDDAGAIDALLLVAGQGDICPADLVVEPAGQVARQVQVNFAAPAALAAAMAERMAGRGRGRILLVGSAAAHHALPFAASYAGSKAGLARFAQALAAAVQGSGVVVTLVSPGFIAADGSASSARPFAVPVTAAAARCIAALARGQRDVVFPWPFRLLRWLDRLLPRPVRDRLLRALR